MQNLNNEKNIDRLFEEKVENYCGYFEQYDDEFIMQYIGNDSASEFVLDNCPLFDCPDKLMELIYYFRWWSFRKHIKNTDDGFVFSEFLPNVPWAKKHNTIVCASGFHLMEARWLKNSTFAEDYLKFWYNAGREGLNDYTSWLPFASKKLADVTGNSKTMCLLKNDFVSSINEFYNGTVKVYFGDNIHYDDNGLFYCFDYYDGGELSVGGDGYRPMFNSAMYANIKAVAELAESLGDSENAKIFSDRAVKIKNAVNEQLWNNDKNFFTVREGSGALKDVRELYGYAPWFFEFADEGYADCFNYLFDRNIFSAPYGLTFTEQSHKEFSLNYSGHECQWNGPIWPMATSYALGALENLLNNYKSHQINKADFYHILHSYAASQLIVRGNGILMPWIDENMNPYTGDWISRTRLKTWENGGWCEGKGGYERGKNYNHSMFCNHIISGLIGIHPDISGTVTVNPLIEAKWWQWFCLDNVYCHGKKITVMWDSDGEHYGVKKGFSVWIDDKCVAASSTIEKIIINLEKSEEIL